MDFGPGVVYALICLLHFVYLKAHIVVVFFNLSVIFLQKHPEDT
jgi:hypothetical protein